MAPGMGAVLVAAAVLLTAVLWGRRARTRDRPAQEPAPEAKAVEVAAAREEERELLCYDLHDGLAPLVVAARMHLEAFRALRHADAERAEYELAAVAQRLDEAVEEVTRIVSFLGVGVSDGAPVGEAVRKHLERLAESSGWEFELVDQLRAGRFDRSIEAMLYRIVQEALNNAARHAQTDRVRVSLSTENGFVTAVVQDWGRGFGPGDRDPSRLHLGLRGMCARARLLGGDCTIESQPGGGTQVRVRVPCELRGGALP